MGFESNDLLRPDFVRFNAPVTNIPKVINPPNAWLGSGTEVKARPRGLLRREITGVIVPV